MTSFAKKKPFIPEVQTKILNILFLDNILALNRVGSDSIIHVKPLIRSLTQPVPEKPNTDHNPENLFPEPYLFTTSSMDRHAVHRPFARPCVNWTVVISRSGILDCR